MSINVTINGNPISIRRGKMVLSDLDLIKKSEKDRRRRLRMEQVRQQSKEISSKLLERAKLVEQEEFNKLQNDENSELRLLHNKKLRDIQQKYQEDMENIGMAHVLAAEQANVDEIRGISKERNKIAAAARGQEASQRLRELNKRKENERLAQLNRRQDVRETENMRSQLITQLPKVGHVDNEGDEIVVDSPQSDDSIPIAPASRNVRLVTAQVHNTDRESSMPRTSGTKEKELRVIKLKKPAKHVNVHVSGAPRTVVICESDDQEPRRIVPTLHIASKTTNKGTRYNPEDYRHGTSESDSTSSSSSVSNDSSYFSDSNDHSATKKKTKQQQPKSSSGSSKVRLYDLNTRQRNLYNMPTEVVEKIDIRNEPNAEDRAREITVSESHFSQLNEKRKLAAESRGKDALLREKTRRDYKNLMASLKDLSREERKLRASQIRSSPRYNVYMQPKRKKECQRKRQRKMERVLESAFRSTRDSSTVLDPTERIITITPRDTDLPNIPPAWQKSPPSKSGKTIRGTELSRSEEEISRNEQILELLKKVERQRFLLLKEYGANLPESIINASLKPLFEQQQLPQQQSQSTPSLAEKTVTTQETASPEIRVINMSGVEESKKKSSKPKKKQAEIAVQTSVREDKSIQAEISPAKQPIEKAPHPLEPVVKIITPAENEDSSSSSRSAFVTDIVIDMSRQQVKVTPKKKKKAVFDVSNKTVTLGPKKKTGERISSPSKRDFSQVTTSIESSSTENSQVQSTPETTPVEGMQYIKTRTTQKIIRIKDTSDSSTSYASPPVIPAGALMSALNYSTPILEMLDSSSPSNNERGKPAVSPVSSPETPTPQTMKLPSNKPRTDRVNRMLFSQTQRSRGTSTERKRTAVLEQFESNQYVQESPRICTCRNPSCKLFHEKRLDQIDELLLQNYPEIARKLQQLHMSSVEKIASLADLIARLRDDRGSDLSAILPMEENLPSQGGAVNADFEMVRNLVSNMEVVQNKLAKTVKETEKLLSGDMRLRSLPSTRKSTDAESSKSPGKKGESRPKPRILANGSIHLNLDRFKATVQPRDGDDIVKKLSKEILEQSKSEDKSRELNAEKKRFVSSKVYVENVEQEPRDDDDFDPVLPQCLSKQTTQSCHGRPPIPGTSGVYRPALAHELSTIVELDTPDAASRTQSSRRSPTSKCRRSLEVSPRKTSDKVPSSNGTSKKSVTPRTSTPARSLMENEKHVAEGTKNIKSDESLSSEKNSEITNSFSNTPSSNDKDKTSISGISGISGLDDFTSEKMELFLQKNKLNWAASMLRKIQEVSALSSTSTNSDVTPVNTLRRTLSPTKKQLESILNDLPGLTDVSSISIKDKNKSTEHGVLLKGRTSTPNLEQSGRSNTERSNSSNTTPSAGNTGSDSLIVPMLSLSPSQTDTQNNTQQTLS